MNQDILNKVKELWPGNVSIDITFKGNIVYIELSAMYSAPGLTFKQLLELSKFFNTDKIDDNDKINQPGCETCDYGSQYGFTLKIELDEQSPFLR